MHSPAHKQDGKPQFEAECGCKRDEIDGFQEGQFSTGPLSRIGPYLLTHPVRGGQHNGGIPPPSAKVGTDSASSALAIRMKRISVFFMVLLCSGWEP